MYRILKKTFVAALALAAAFPAAAQLEFRFHPVVEESPLTRARLAQTQQTDTLSLPFWDDFSQADRLPDTALWLNSGTVTISAHIGIDAPTINVATFNGVNAMGEPYSATQNSGLTDTLTSKPIDLSGLTSEQRNSLYFSFFWQAQGYGEMPNEGDSIRVQFKSSENIWYTAWSKAGTNIANTQFTHVDPIKVEDRAGFDEETFFHDHFQFRFQAYGNQGGDFDAWNIDYVYLNHGRSADDRSYKDEALTAPLTSLFSPYYAIPLEHLKNAPEKYLATPVIQYYNLSDQSGLSSILYAAVSAGGENNYVVDSLFRYDDNKENDLFGAFERRDIPLGKLNIDSLSLLADSSSVRLQAIAYIDSEDSIENGVNYAVNDTVKSEIVLDKHYAYDDGTAEMGAGVGKSGVQLAVEFVLAERDTLTDIDIYFPAFSGSGGASTVRLHVWKKLNRSAVLHRQTITVQRGGLNEFVRFPLERHLVLTDTFYIGYEQNFDGHLFVGFDRNNNSIDKIYNNTSGQDDWTPVPDDMPGSLMMRPVFQNSLLTSVKEPSVFKNVMVYPNPTDGEVIIKGLRADQIRRITVLDNFGRTLQVAGSPVLNLSGYPAGVYLIRITTDKETLTRKIVLKR